MNTETKAVPEVKTPKFCEKSSENGVLSFKFGNGTVLTLDLSEVPEETQDDLRDHGALQKIGDSYASAGGDFAFAIASASKVIDNLKNGLWGSARAAGEGKTKIGELATALAQLQSKPVEEVTIALEAATDEQKKALRAHPAIKAKIAELRAIKAAEALAKAGAAGALPTFG
jgi:hypothetical protein